MAGIRDAGFTYCTPIQSKALPIALAGRDVAGQAQTGTGKTAAYLIALFQHLLTHEPLDDAKPGPRALILAPTRELAVQIHNDAAVLGKYLPYKLGLAFGGTDYEKQKRQLSEGVDVLIGTPGRLIDFFKQGIFGLRRVQVAVLDEADRMFDLGFLRDIRYILRKLPPAPQRLNLLFSATLSYRVLELAYEHMNDPELIRIEPDKLTVDRVRQVIYFPSNEEKLPLLITLLREMDAKRTMVFVNTRRAAEFLRDALEHNGITAAAISGDVPQRKRLKLLRDFTAGELPVLIATDVASRGLHVPDVSHVFNYDLPQDPEDYVHRVGRTARAGASGDAISFGCEDYVISLPDIEAYIGRKIEVVTYDPDKLVKVSLPPKSRRSDRRDRGERRESRAARPAHASPPAKQDALRPEHVEAAEPSEAVGVDDRPPAGAGEPAQTESGEKRRRRRRRRRGAARADGNDQAQRAEHASSPDTEGARVAEAEDAASRSVESAGTSEAARDDGRDGQGRPSSRRRRRRRGRRGAARQAADQAADGSAGNAEREATRDRRRQRNGEGTRPGGKRRSGHNGRRQGGHADAQTRGAEASQSADLPTRALGLLQRIWSVFKRQ